MQSLSAFLLLFDDKKYLLKANLTCTFIYSLLIFLICLAVVQNRGKDVHIKAVMLLMRLEVLRAGFFCFPGKVWEGG